MIKILIKNDEGYRKASNALIQVDFLPFWILKKKKKQKQTLLIGKYT